MIQSVEKISRNVIFIDHDPIYMGEEQYYLLRSDAHHDSKFCDAELERKHLEKAVELNAGILDFGDIFDAMQGRHDPRRAYTDMKPEYAERLASGETSYLNLIVEDLANFYAPYAKNIKLFAKGNHESSVERHNDVNLIERLAQMIYVKTGEDIPTGGYGGYVRFRFPSKSSITLKYFHGAGGGNSPVTKGVIQSNRQAVFVPDADIVVNGHIHESWVLTIPRERISSRGTIFKDLQYHVRTATYKEEYVDGSGGWHVESGKPPKPIGAIWLKFFLEDDVVRMSITQDVK